ncbi:MAG: TetR/AcrR family transcriptional regulator [Pseudonocardia sp.]|nr:TetR/AcrR family transcriptional regulator [Pseudonocardia sp.]
MSGETGLRERKKRATRDRIRHEGVRLFLAHGFEAVSIVQIAEAAEVSKMTVTNYFPAKEDIFFGSRPALFPDLGAVVGRRAAGQPPVRALRRFVLAELDRRAEWTGLHDGVTQFTRLIWASPALLSAATRQWATVREALVAALADAAGTVSARGAGWDWSVPREDNAPPVADPADLHADRLAPRLVAEQILAVVQTLSSANQLRQLAGVRAGDSAGQARATAELGFDLLEQGLASWPR